MEFLRIGLRILLTQMRGFTMKFYSLRNNSYTMTTLLLIIIFALTYFISLKNYLLSHTFFELFAATVSMTIFSIGWNTRDFSKNNFMTVLAAGYLVVGILIIFHVLTYKGMGVFPNYGTDTPTQFWITTRYIESMTMLAASLSINRKKQINAKLTFGIYIAIGLILVLLIFLEMFPKCFDKSSGLTLFKIISEYIICGI